MATYTVTKQRREGSADGSHQHIKGVITTAGVYYSRGEVVASIDAGSTWQTSAGGNTAIIRKLAYCPRTKCYATPYISTNPDSTKQDNLENLPEG